MDKKTIKNYAYNLAYQVLVLIAPLVTTPYVSRVLHSDGIGDYSYTFTIATAFSLFAALGVNSYGQREIAYRQDDLEARSKVFWELVTLRAAVSAVVLVAYIIYSMTYIEFRVYLLAQTFVVAAVMLDISWFFQGVEDFKPIAVRNAFVKLVTIGFIFLFVKDEGDVWIYCLINALSMAVGNLFFFVGLRKRVVQIPWSELDVCRHVPGTLQFFVPILAVQVYSQLDKILLGALANDAVQNGYYEQVRKISNFVVTLVVSLNSVLYSRNAHLFSAGDKEGMRQSMRESFTVIWMVMLPFVVGLFLASENLVGWFFGPEYEPVALLLRVSCPLIVLMCVGNFVGLQYLSPTGLQNRMTAAYIVAAVVDVISNVILAPHLLALGALCAAICAEFCSCGLQLWMLMRSEYRFHILADLVPYVTGAAAMGVVLVGWQHVTPFGGAMQTVSEMGIGAFVYAIVLAVWPGTIIYKLMRAGTRMDA